MRLIKKTVKTVNMEVLGKADRLWILRFFLIAFLLTLPFYLPAQPQLNLPAEGLKITPQLIIRRTPIQFNPNLVNIIKRNPIPFKPFTLEELKLAPQSEVILENGAKLKAEDFIAQMNELERKFNELGYSLREPGDVTIQICKLNKDVFDRTRQVLLGSVSQKPNFFVPSLSQKALMTPNFTLLTPKPLISPVALSPEAMEKQMETAKRIAEMVENKTAKAKPQGIKKLKLENSYSKSLGDENILAVEVDAYIGMKGEKDKLELKASGKGTGYLFGESTEIVYGEARLNSSKDKANSSIVIRALGYDLWYDERDTFISYQDSQSKGIDQAYTGNFMIGPIPVSVTLGFKGVVGIDYGFCLTPSHISGILSPYIDTRGYAEAGVDVVVASAGAGAELTFLKDRLNLQTDLGIELAGDEPFFVVRYGALNELEALNGSIYAYTKIDYLIGSKKFTWDIFNWDGVKTNGYIIGPREYVQSLITGQQFSKETVSVVVTRLKTPYPAGFCTILFGTSAYSALDEPASPTDEFIWFGKEIKWQKEIIPPSDKKVVIVMEVWGPRKADREKGIMEVNHRLNLDPTGEDIVLIYDLEKGTFTGDAVGKRGDRITLKGEDGEIEFYLPLKLKGAPAKAK
ncbi:hypothetical protein H5T87_02110 [bacterium]|nr:hypothetical protein [bacterium]